MDTEGAQVVEAEAPAGEGAPEAPQWLDDFMENHQRQMERHQAEGDFDREVPVYEGEDPVPPYEPDGGWRASDDDFGGPDPEGVSEETLAGDGPETEDPLEAEADENFAPMLAQLAQDERFDRLSGELDALQEQHHNEMWEGLRAEFPGIDRPGVMERVAGGVLELVDNLGLPAEAAENPRLARTVLLALHGEEVAAREQQRAQELQRMEGRDFQLEGGSGQPADAEPDQTSIFQAMHARGGTPVQRLNRALARGAQ